MPSESNQAVTSYGLRDNNMLVMNMNKKAPLSKPDLHQDGDLTLSKTASISQFLSNDMSLSLTPSVDPKSTGIDKDHSRHGAHDSMSQWKVKQNQTFFSGGFKNRLDVQKRKAAQLSQFTMNKDALSPQPSSPIIEASEPRRSNNELHSTQNHKKSNDNKKNTLDNVPTLRNVFSDPNLQLANDIPSTYIPKQNFASRPQKKLFQAKKKSQIAEIDN